MRSSKSRSRNKQRNRSVGNIVNRVFDSSGPEGKVRGTPQQIIDKYNQLARDAQLSGDRVATENFQQHAEHYTRMLAEAQKEQDQRREQQEQQQRDRQQQKSDQRPDQSGKDRDDPQAAEQPQPQQHEEAKQQNGNGQKTRNDRNEAPGDVIDFGSEDDDSGLVETPESKPQRKPRSRKPKAKTENGGDAPDEKASDAAAAE
ncbi:DUF4167 domain-containing protein [Pseudoruegeria sp. HB172150]|uniref:DUF4167 domain-containing protein n=1 Tax=Pseudoruegeria sp. HB172150 TaxID=2721164 RepID=UPI001557B859|nr:DUF4167 domain-containing protein [Pseudoruegeria sp. HB172150]